MHQYINRDSGKLETERLYQDRVVQFFYGPVRERMPMMFRWLTNARTTRLLGYLNYDTRWGSRACRRFLQQNGVSLEECLDDPAGFTTPRQVFERKIKYWECRPMPIHDDVVVSPADARVLIGSLQDESLLFLKDKFFDLDELLARDKPAWRRAFRGADFAIFRLTPEKYHYNHVPVTGRVVDVYEIEGSYHSCNPSAVVRVATPYSKNRRIVTILDTDVDKGTGIGLVAMIEVVALMIGEIEQCYSEIAYDRPRPIQPGMLLRRGAPKSLFRPGSSTTVLLFQRHRVRFAEDLLRNQRRSQGISRYSLPFRQSLLETDLRVRSPLAEAVTCQHQSAASYCVVTGVFS